MTTPLARVAAGALLALGVAVVIDAAGAQTPRPSPTPAPTPVAFAAHAHANVTVVAQGTTYSGSAQFAVAQRAELTRIDLLSLRSDSFPVPPLSVTVVIDRRANTLTAWSDATKMYRVQPFIPRAIASLAPRPSPAPRASATPRPVRGTSPFAKLEVLDVTLHMTGHTTTAGVPTTGLAFDLQVRNRGDAASSHVTATTQLADELAVFPMTLDVSIEPGTAPFSAKLAYAVDDLTRSQPPATSFQVPQGYKEASSLLGVIFPQRSAPVPQSYPTSPLPKASP